MIKVGLTGGIGSGKSLISNVFRKLGVSVYDSDSATKNLYLTDNVLKKNIIAAFGKEAYYPNGELNRTHLANLIFNNKQKLQLINQIVHPRVKLDFEAWLQENKDEKYIIKEAAILIESEAYKLVDKIIVVTAPVNIRLRRVALRDHIGEDEIKKRMSNQLLDNELIAYADFIIANGDSDNILPQVLKIHNLLS